MSYKISNSIIIEYKDLPYTEDRIGQADINIENLARKLRNKGKCVSRKVCGGCYLDTKQTWWSIAKEYEIVEQEEEFKNIL